MNYGLKPLQLNYVYQSRILFSVYTLGLFLVSAIFEN